MSVQGVALSCSLAQADAAALRTWWLGWNDSLADRPYPFRYDGWRKEVQTVYEAGRLYAANVRAAGLGVPSWGGSRAGLAAVSIAVNRSCRQTGDPVP